MKYSIIIPTLNEEKLLPKLLNQLTPPLLKKQYDYEIIVSDGGSSDSTTTIALENSDKLVVHEKPEKQNISMGRNAGAKHAEGEWLIFLNGDVLISDVEHFFKMITDISSSGVYKGITFSVMIEPENEKLKDILFLNFYNYYFHFLNIIGVGMGRGECLILPRDLFWRLNGFNEELAAGEDFDLFKRVRRHGKIYFSHKVCLYESPRRYRKYGHFHIFFKWLLNSIFVLIAKKSLSKEWEEVR